MSKISRKDFLKASLASAAIVTMHAGLGQSMASASEENTAENAALSAAEEADEVEYRIEKDTMGEMKVPADRYWGAQTQRSRENFQIGVGVETMPHEIIVAFGLLKQAAARANNRLQPEKLTDEKLAVIEQAAMEVSSGQLY